MFKLATKANMGCGPLPLYSQDATFMNIKSDEDLDNWLLIDLFIKGPRILNWDIETLDFIPNEHLEEIYCSHALEHISHRQIVNVLKLWHSKLKEGGTIIINVPDLMYAFKQLKMLEDNQKPEGLYKEPLGLHSPLSIIYGTHSQAGEYHLGGFTIKLLEQTLSLAGFDNISVETQYDDHQMDVLIGRAIK